MSLCFPNLIRGHLSEKVDKYRVWLVLVASVISGIDYYDVMVLLTVADFLFFLLH